MKKKHYIPSTNANGKRKASKWAIFILLKNGYCRKRIEETLNLHKTTILGHIRDFKKEGLIPEHCTGYYHITKKGWAITELEFNKLFYRGGGWSALEIEVPKNFRFHNLFFKCEILRTPNFMPNDCKKVEFSRNNQYYCKKYKNGLARFHTQKCVLHIEDFTAENVDIGSLEVIKRLNLLIEEVQNEGFKLDTLFKLNSEHIADMYHPLACLFKTRGREVLVEGIGGNRLVIDFSHGVPELETENKFSSEDDMKKVKLWFNGLLNLTEREIKQILENGITKTN